MTPSLGFLQSAFDNAPIGVALCTPQGTVLQVNAALARLVGRAADDLAGGDLFGLTHPEDRTAARAACLPLDPGDAVSTEHDTRLLRPDGSVLSVCVRTTLVPADGDRVAHLVLQVEDMTRRTALQQQLLHQAMHDPLTGLPNRLLLLDRLAQGLARATRAGTALAVLYLDLDGFKAVNDTLGHAAGDEVLREVGSRLLRTIRPNDTAARIGGDEFCLCCDLGDDGQAGPLVQRVSEALRQPVRLRGPGLAEIAVRIGVSIGLVGITTGGPASPEELLAEADQAMYAVKTRRVVLPR